MECEELATDSMGGRQKLSRQIFLDEFDEYVNGVEDDEYEDEEDEFIEDEEDDDDYSEDNAEHGSNPPVASGKQRTVAKVASQLPRFYARFDFAVIESIMRIFPTTNAHPQHPFRIKNNPNFTYRGRGRETGESEISGLVSFRGTKVRHRKGQSGSSRYEWSELSEAAYEMARVGRSGEVDVVEC